MTNDCRGKPKMTRPTCCTHQDLPAINNVKNHHSLFQKRPDLLLTGKPEGQKTPFELTAKPLDRTQPSQCLDDCRWKKNEFSQEPTFWWIGGWNLPNPCSGEDATMSVQIRFTLSVHPQKSILALMIVSLICRRKITKRSAKEALNQQHQQLQKQRRQMNPT